jgi:hypothetical protein
MTMYVKYKMWYMMFWVKFYSKTLAWPKKYHFFFWNILALNLKISSKNRSIKG